MLESTNQLRRSHLQLLLVRLGQACQQAISFGSEFHQDFPSILLTFHALYCPQFLQARDKPYGAVVLMNKREAISRMVGLRWGGSELITSSA